MITGVDISVWQDAGVLDGWQFAILNHADPTFSSKLDEVVRLGIPYAMYGWLYPGRGRESLTRMHAHAELLELNHDRLPTFFWLDYEQNGVIPDDLRDGLQAAVDENVAWMTGTYTYLATVGSVAHVIDAYSSPLWLAYYPWPNDGRYPAGQEGDALRWGAVIWQYSSGGNLDRNRALDEAWYHAHHEGGAIPPTVDPTPEATEMYIVMDFIKDCWLMAGNVRLITYDPQPANMYGVPEEASQFAAGQIPIRKLHPLQMETLHEVSRRLGVTP